MAKVSKSKGKVVKPVAPAKKGAPVQAPAAPMGGGMPPMMKKGGKMSKSKKC